MLGTLPPGNRDVNVSGGAIFTLPTAQQIREIAVDVLLWLGEVET